MIHSTTGLLKNMCDRIVSGEKLLGSLLEFQCVKDNIFISCSKRNSMLLSLLFEIVLFWHAHLIYQHVFMNKTNGTLKKIQNHPVLILC